MAVIQEHFFIGERDFVRSFSDSKRYVVRDDVSYVEACDPAEFGRTYTEGEPILTEDDRDELADKAEAFDILMGVTT